jgi:hypothetical protein
MLWRLAKEKIGRKVLIVVPTAVFHEKDVKQTKVLLKYIYSSTVSSAHGGTRRPMQRGRLCINSYGY